MKQIPLSQGLVALIDDEDFERVVKYKWCAHKASHRLYYAKTNILSENGKYKVLYLHRFIMMAIYGQVIDHRDRNPLNCQKQNMRIASNGQNNSNRTPKKNGTSRYLGVCWCKHKKRWSAQIRKDKKTIAIGKYNNEIEAAKAYNK